MAAWSHISSTRRTFLASVILPSIGAVIGLSACGDDTSDGADSGIGDTGVDVPPDVPIDVSLEAPEGLDVAALVAAYFGDAPLDSVRLIGRSYIRDFPDHAALEADMAELFDPLEEASADADLVAIVEGLVAADLDANRVHLLEGWTIAPNELRMCVMAESFA